MAKYTDEELCDNKLGLKHRRMGLFETVTTDSLVQHPDTPAYYDGRMGFLTGISSTMKTTKKANNFLGRGRGSGRTE